MLPNRQVQPDPGRGAGERGSGAGAARQVPVRAGEAYAVARAPLPAEPGLDGDHADQPVSESLRRGGDRVGCVRRGEEVGLLMNLIITPKWNI